MTRRSKLATRELVVFAMLGAIMFLSKLLMEWAPNIHFLAMFTVTFTVVYREKALFPLYVSIFLTGLYAGFNIWWFPYLYIWTVLWAAAMLLPRSMPPRVAVPVYMIVCGLHGALYGVLYAPAQALFYGLSFEGTVAWILAGLPFDLLHAIGDVAAGVLVLPLSELLKQLDHRAIRG